MRKTERIVAYPAVLIANSGTDDVYTVEFPDVKGAITEGKGMADACDKASEALGLMLYDAADLPKATDLKQVIADYPADEVKLITVDLDKVKKAVRKPID